MMTPRATYGERFSRWGGILWLMGVVAAVTPAPAAEPPLPTLRVGWASVDITPPRAVSIIGFHGKRISTGVRDPVRATALALEAVDSTGKGTDLAVFVSCDLLWIRKATQEAVREVLRKRFPELDTEKLVIHATHTHQGPATESGVYAVWDPTPQEKARGVMSGDEYRAYLADRLAEAAMAAWKRRAPGGVAWALDQAVVGFNRRFVYFDGTAKMLGPVATPDFDCIEGVEDHGLLVLCFWDAQKKLTGLAINVASPAQADQGGSLLSADFWHDVREEMAARHGRELFVLPQCGAAGDIYPQAPFRHRAEIAMAQRKGIPWRREIARRIADGVDRALPALQAHIDTQPVFKHTVARFEIPMASPPVPPFYTCDSVAPAEIHLLRLGDVALVTCPFELFTDYGIRIQTRSKAVATFVIQLACHHSGYLPTARAVRGGGYSADRYLVGPEGGRVFVDQCVARINALWP